MLTTTESANSLIIMAYLEVVGLSTSAGGQNIIAGRKCAVAHKEEPIATAVFANNILRCFAADASMEPCLNGHK